MTISLSTDALVDNILALAAMRHAVNPSDTGTLSRDRRPAIARLARAAAAPVALALMPEITGCNVLDEPDGSDTTDPADSGKPSDRLITFELRENCMADPMVLRMLIEHTVTAGILAAIYSGTDDKASAIYADDHAASLRRLSRAVSAARPPVRLRPCPG